MQPRALKKLPSGAEHIKGPRNNAVCRAEGSSLLTSIQAAAALKAQKPIPGAWKASACLRCASNSLRGSSLLKLSTLPPSDQEGRLSHVWGESKKSEVICTCSMCISRGLWFRIYDWFLGFQLLEGLQHLGKFEVDLKLVRL